MNRKMTRLALGGEVRRLRGASGLAGARPAPARRRARPGRGSRTRSRRSSEPVAAARSAGMRHRSHRNRLRTVASRAATQFTYRKSTDANSAWNSMRPRLLGVAAVGSRRRNRSADRALAVGRRAAQRQPVGPVDARPRRRGRGSASSRRGGVPRLLQDERVVHQEQRLRGDRARRCAGRRPCSGRRSRTPRTAPAARCGRPAA